MSAVDLDAFRDAPLEAAPFPHLVVPNFLKPDSHAAIARDFPAIEKGGSFAPSDLDVGPAVQALLDELSGPDIAAAFGDKFGIDLSDRPTTLTLRGRARMKDGKIHTDSKTKLITVLLYLNPDWAEGNEGGRLRLLRGADDIEDYVTEIPPHMGSMVAFKCTPNAWHGHLPFEGPRRSVQLNWVTDQDAVAGSRRRHRLSAFIKRLLPA